ncbi:VEGF co-regulated chemokine 1 [Heterocephalus glaber]|uniref:VEGF co-regulated chemokine 1 n=1 Tax=Heterocephalus glaber TaxID=10181 RepID=G5AZS0_HETGA|nr:VEGF co-regulated chemokine 1 [Heterocephalus glaber]
MKVTISFLLLLLPLMLMSMVCSSPNPGHRRHHKKPNKHLQACQEFLKRCQLASLALPL